MANKMRNGHAVVVGASIAGLLAGRVLSEFFDRVTLLDKEPLDGEAAPRKAVPQGNHIHAILTPAYQVLKRFLPEVIDDLISGGAHIFDAGRDLNFFILGNWLTRGETGQTIIGATRPFFEYHLRRNVEVVNNIDIKPGRRFSRWLTDDSGKRFTGIVYEDEGGEHQDQADLLVDARGRASALPAELSELGFGLAPEDTVGVDLGYTSRLFRAPGFNPDWSIMILNPSAPETWTGGLMERVEGDRWIVTMFGYFNDHAPATEEGFLEYARSLEAPDIANFLEIAQPVSDFHKFGTPKCVMRRFEKMVAFPDRLLAIGDTVCNLNPVYGQGLTKAAREAEFLWETLSAHLSEFGSLHGFSDSFRLQLPNAGAEWAWQLTTGADFGFRQTTGERPSGAGFMGWYMTRLFTRSAKSLGARKGVFDATMLIKPPDSLMQPRMMLHALGF